MSHETENPLIIDVVGEVEPSEPAEQHASKKANQAAGRKGFFKREKATSSATAAQATAEADVSAAKPDQAQAQAIGQQSVQTQAPQGEAPQPQPASPQPGQPVPPASAQPVQSGPQQPQQPQPVQPVSSGFVSTPMNQPFRQGNMAAAAAVPQKSKAFFVFGILAVLVVVFALVAIGFYTLFQSKDQNLLIPTSQMSQESDEVKPIVSASLDQASKVSLRATAENWNEETSTPVVAYIKRVEDAADGADENSTAERYFAFAPNESASISLPSGRYAFNFIVPLNADGSLYAVPDVVDMVVGDGGMAVLPVEFTLISKEEATPDQITRALAQLKTASEKGDSSFANEAFKRSIDLALNTWFPQEGAAVEHPATELTQEQQEALNAQADSQGSVQNESGSSDAASTEHTHDWVAQHEQRWQPAVVPVIDAAAWESPVYARYRCREGILFETLEACLAHVRERGNEPYTASNEIIRIDYHPAVVHYEEQGSYENVVTGYRCSICGARGTL